MSNYFKELNENIKEYFKILSPEIPEFLEEYVDTPEMQKQAGISVTCGTIYSKLFDKSWYSSLDHSVAVALIIWNFTKDKKQTLAGLFHDISTPAFKHCIDIMNEDNEKQEFTEGLTEQTIRQSKEIMKLLNRDEIEIEQISDYSIYPIADNDTPKLSADRLEYTLSNGLGVVEKLWKLQDVRRIYEDIEIQKNENGIQELGFKSKEIAEKFVHNMSKMSINYLTNKTKFSIKFIADIVKRMLENNLITQNDLYNLTEKEIIEKIENCEYNNISKCFNIWKNATYINESDDIVEGKYCINQKQKMRYINPLVQNGTKYVRINEISDIAKEDINRCLNFKTKKYAYLDFNF